MEEVIIVAENQFPLSYAATTRVYLLCKLFQSLQYQTTVFIINVHEKKRFDLKEQGIFCRWFPWEDRNPFYPLRKHKKVIESIQKRKNLKYVIVYQEILFQMRSLADIAKKRGFEVIAYFDEWYEWEKVEKSKFWWRTAVNTSMVSIRLSEYFTASKFKKKIVISRSLKRFYRQDECLLLPTLVDLEEELWKRGPFEAGERIVIVYAGWPGNRDDLRMLVEVVNELPQKQKKRILLRIFTYNTSEECLRTHIPGLDRIKKANEGIIEFMGEVSREQVIEELKKADFSYLLRENKWFNNAVFSTKIGESLAVGTPMFANCTSDIGYYIKDGFNGIIIEDMSKRAVHAGLYKILGLSKEQRIDMKQNAYRTAEKYFDYRRYKKKMREFLEKNEGG